jgi:hypothetical protein
MANSLSELTPGTHTDAGLKISGVQKVFPGGVVAL